jgi:outer membrane protein assembly factor BamB
MNPTTISLRRTLALTATAAIVFAGLPPAHARTPSKWQRNSSTRWEVGGGGDDFRTGFAPQEKAPPFISCNGGPCTTTGDADGPWLEWTTKISDLPTGIYPQAGVAVVDGIVYISGASTNTFLALDARTGLPVWRFAPDPRTDASTSQYPASNAPVVKNGIVYTTFNNGYMYALHAKSGRKIWSYRATEGYQDTCGFTVQSKDPGCQLDSSGEYARPGDADHPARASLKSYSSESQPSSRGPLNPVHPNVNYPAIHGATGYCEGVAMFMTLAGWVYGLDGKNGKLLWKRYADGPDYPGELVWPEYKLGGALRPENSSLGASTRRFEAVPGLACLNGEVQVAGSDGHVRFLNPHTGKQGGNYCGYDNVCDRDEGGGTGPEYERLGKITGPPASNVDMCASAGFNCDIAVGLSLPPLGAAGGGDYIVTTLDARVIKLAWDTHAPKWRRTYTAPFPFEQSSTMPVALSHLEDGFVAQAVVGGPMALDPDLGRSGENPILYFGSQDGHLYALSVNQLGEGLRQNDPTGPRLLTRLCISPNKEPATPYTRRDEGGPWDCNQHALSGLVLGGNVLYVPTWDNKITAYDVRPMRSEVGDPRVNETLRKVWQYEIRQDESLKYPPFGCSVDEAQAGAKRRECAAFPKGPFADLDNKIFSSAALLNGHLYFVANDGVVYAFNLQKRVSTVRNLVILGSGIVPALPSYTEALGAFDNVWTPADWYRNQVAPPGYRLPKAGGVAGAAGLVVVNAIMWWLYRRREDVRISVEEAAP